PTVLGVINGSPLNGIFPAPLYYSKSAAVMHKSFTNDNTELNMSAAGVNTRNRFWNCARAIETYNTFDFKLSNAILRSTQTATQAALQNHAGETGLNLSSNRANYSITNNEFTNIKNAINIPISAVQIGSAISTGTAFGQTTITPVYG